MERRNFKRIAKLMVAGFSLVFLPMQPAVAQTLSPQPIQSIVERAETNIGNQQYGAAIDDYLSVLDRAPDAMDLLRKSGEAISDQAASLSNCAGLK